MLRQLFAPRGITPPAIFGKLPAHADYVRSRVRHGESEDWQAWLSRHGRVAECASVAALPAAFVLPPAALGFAKARFVMGVVAPSMDKVGRLHALLVYQLADVQWLRQHFGRRSPQPRDWLFVLARAVARNANGAGAGGFAALEHDVDRAWRTHTAARTGDDAAASADARYEQAMQSLLEEWDNAAGAAGDAARQLRGVRHFPWADWPECIFQPHFQGAFWQQDARGGYLDVAASLPALWGAPE